MPKNTKTLELFLIRHGRSTWNHEGRVQGHKNPPLSDDGKKTVRQIARQLRARFGPFRESDTVIVSSPLRRALETAQIFSASFRLPIVRRPDLREAKLGEWEGRKVEEIRRTDLERLKQWYRDPTKVSLRGAESIPDFQKRVRREMRRLLYIYGEADRLWIVTHGGWISTLLTDVIGIPLGRMWTFVLDNGSLTRLHWDGKKLYLRSFNESPSNPLNGSIKLA